MLTRLNNSTRLLPHARPHQVSAVQITVTSKVATEAPTSRIGGSVDPLRRAHAAWDDSLMDQDDPDNREADLRSAQDGAAKASPQTPGYLRRSRLTLLRRIAIVVALFVGGLIVVIVGAEARLTGAAQLGLVVLGAVLILLSAVLPVRWLMKFKAETSKEQALRKRGTVELLTAASTFKRSQDGNSWELRSELQILLDSGPTFSGSYRTAVEDWRLRDWGRPLDAWFRVGATLRCLYNPTNPDQVLVFPHAGRGTEVTYSELTTTGPDHVWFYSAT